MRRSSMRRPRRRTRPKPVEGAGKAVSRVTIDGRRIEIDLVQPEEMDKFERIDMRYDKT